jgi:hypothetical protein
MSRRYKTSTVLSTSSKYSMECSPERLQAARPWPVGGGTHSSIQWVGYMQGLSARMGGWRARDAGYTEVSRSPTLLSVEASCIQPCTEELELGVVLG